MLLLLLLLLPHIHHPRPPFPITLQPRRTQHLPPQRIHPHLPPPLPLRHAHLPTHPQNIPTDPHPALDLPAPLIRVYFALQLLPEGLAQGGELAGEMREECRCGGFGRGEQEAVQLCEHDLVREGGGGEQAEEGEVGGLGAVGAVY